MDPAKRTKHLLFMAVVLLLSLAALPMSSQAQQPTHFDVDVGPMMDERGDPVPDADMSLFTAAGQFTNRTDISGLARFRLPFSLNDTNVTVVVGHKRYDTLNFSGHIDNLTGFVPDGVIPRLERSGGGEGASETGGIALLPYPVCLMTVMIILLVGVMMAIGGTEIGIFALYSLVFYLYSRISTEKVLDNFTRGQIYGHIMDNPGVSFSELVRMSNVKNGTMTYHLKTLEREGFVKAYTSGTRKLFYPFRMQINRSEVELTKAQRFVYSIIKGEPGISQRAIAREANMPISSVNYIVRSLADRGLLRVEKGKSTRCYISEDAS